MEDLPEPCGKCGRRNSLDTLYDWPGPDGSGRLVCGACHRELSTRYPASAATQIEQGLVRFGDDLPGVFIRADVALFLANELARKIGEPRPDAKAESLEGLVLLLRSASRSGEPCAVALLESGSAK